MVDAVGEPPESLVKNGSSILPTINEVADNYIAQMLAFSHKVTVFRELLPSESVFLDIL